MGRKLSSDKLMEIAEELKKDPHKKMPEYLDEDEKQAVEDILAQLDSLDKITRITMNRLAIINIKLNLNSKIKEANIINMREQSLYQSIMQDYFKQLGAIEDNIADRISLYEDIVAKSDAYNGRFKNKSIDERWYRANYDKLAITKQPWFQNAVDKAIENSDLATYAMCAKARSLEMEAHASLEKSIAKCESKRAYNYKDLLKDMLEITDIRAYNRSMAKFLVADSLADALKNLSRNI